MPTAIGFTGTHELRIDDKGRLTIPSRFKNIIAEQYPDDDMQVMVMVSLDLNLKVLPLSEYVKETAKYEHFNDLDEEVRRLKEVFTGLAEQEKVDGGGRIRIAGNLRDIAKIDRDVTLVGGAGHFTIWDRAKWAANQARILSNMQYLTEQARLKNPTPLRQA